MGLIQILKNLFRKNDIKALPEANSENKQTDNSWLISGGYGNTQPQLSKLDVEILDFLNSYSKNVSQINANQPINNYKIAYASLVQSNEVVTQEQYTYNSFRESETLTNYALNNSYQVTPQDGFYHIMSQNYQMPNFEDMTRVYINCKSEYISELAKTITDSNTNPNFYMKFTGNEANAQNPRNEKIVIYCNKNETDYTLGLINYCKNMRPELFQDSKTLPFIKSKQGIASVASQPTTNQYVGLQRQTKQIPQSVNAFITNMLEESYMEAAREIARSDSNLSFLLDPNYYNNETLYVQNYPYISQYYSEYLLNSMKAKLEFLSKNNNIEIDGLQQNCQYYENNNKEMYKQQDESSRY